MQDNKTKKQFFIRIILPTLLVFSLFTISIFVIILPAFENNMLERKREMINELTNSAWSILEEFHQKEQIGELSSEVAKQYAITSIQYLRYGDERKDYFWITDMHPNMVMHPYRSELNNTDLSNYLDSEGKKLFVEFVKTVEANGEGYVDYLWQWKDDSTRIVPKLSFVKGFEPWGWIIGTGIYIEDVKEEIGVLTRNLIYISLTILVVLALILFYVSQQSLRIVKKRQLAEKNLRESEAKYRALVEASTEGLVMMLDSKYVYANQGLLNMLGYIDETADELNIEDILCENSLAKNKDICYFKSLQQDGLRQSQVETQLQKQDGRLIDVVLDTSEITLGEKSGYTIIIKDISKHKKIRDELGHSIQKYQALIDSVEIGLFRTTFGRDTKLIEANKSVLDILGFSEKDELFKTNIFDFFHNKTDQKSFIKNLVDNGEVKNRVLQIRKKNGSLATISMSAVTVQDESGKPIYCDGIIEDITDKIKLSEEREDLIVEMQTSLRFLNEPVNNFIKKSVVCDMNWPISKVAKQMTKQEFSAALLTTENNEYIGIVTDSDLRKRVVAEKLEVSEPIFKIMTTPIISIPSNAFVFQALLYLHEKGKRHLAVKNSEGDIIGIVSSEELYKVHLHSSTYLVREIENAETVENIITSRNKLPRLITTLVDSGAKTKNITQIITYIFDTIVHKLITFTIEELGPPPVKFAFIALGSAGRGEQTLISDQDNAIIFEDVPESEKENAIKYFQQLGNKVCDWLNDCGYVYCSGEAMASNPKWTQPFTKWKEYFHSWIVNSDPQDLLELSIFFDFRCVYGEAVLATNLRNYLFKAAEGQAGFFQHLAKNSLYHKPPVGLLGKIVVESKGEHPKTFDIKTATMPVTDFARIYAIQNKIRNTNSLERLNDLREKGIINKNTYEELVQVYSHLMHLRFKHHASQITNNSEADNFIDPNEFTRIEQQTLKNAFTQISSIQKKLSYDFSGEAM